MLQKVFQALQENKFDDAEVLLSQILHSDSSNVVALELMGVVCGLQKRPDHALSFFKRCLALSPENTSLYFNIAKALTDLKKDREAIQYHIKAVEVDPNNFEPWLNYGLSLSNIGLHKDALECYGTALKLKPDLMPAWFNRGLSLNQLGFYGDALHAFEETYKLFPSKDYLFGLIWKQRRNICQWNAHNEFAEVITKSLIDGQKSIDPFSASLLLDDEAAMLDAAKIYANDLFTLNLTVPPPKHPKHQKIKIAYFSADFRKHPVAQLIVELFERHDRTRFELYGFSLRDPENEDDLRLRIKDSFDHFYEVENKTDQEIAALARELEIDIAVDLGGHTQYAQTGIFACRAAPIQVNYLGYPGTMGAPYMDYIVADPILIPQQSQEFYVEKIAYLPDTYQPNDRKRQIASKQFTKSELGLPEQGFVFCCFNNNFKINPQVFDCWATILKQVPGSVLWLLEDNALAKDNLQKEALARGIAPERLVFAGRLETSEHLARHALADLFLDTFPYNAHTTASDALWAGLPVLTVIGQSFAARVAASLLNAMDLPELITQNQQEYEALAVEQATHPEKLAQIKQKIQDHRLTKPLFDTPRYTQNIEAAYTQMYERYQADLPPDHLYI